MGKSYEGSLLGKGLKFGLIVSRFNEFFTRKLLEGAQDALVRHGVSEADIEVAWTPGSFEIPLVAQKMALSKKYDAVIAMYHDQALAPFKMLYFKSGVNVTLGLPFVRTSPDHGTAFDIAGKGIADPSSMIEAIRLACSLAGKRC